MFPGIERASQTSKTSSSNHGGAVDNASTTGYTVLYNRTLQNQSFGVILGICRNADLNISISVLRTSVRNPAGNHRIFQFDKKLSRSEQMSMTLIEG